MTFREFIVSPILFIFSLSCYFLSLEIYHRGMIVATINETNLNWWTFFLISILYILSILPLIVLLRFGDDFKSLSKGESK